MNTPEDFEIALQPERYSARCTLCYWQTDITPSHDNGWWFHSLRVHAWHFCPPRQEPNRSADPKGTK